MKKILLIALALSLGTSAMVTAQGLHKGWNSHGLHKGFVDGMAPGQAKKGGGVTPGECTGVVPVCPLGEAPICDLTTGEYKCVQTTFDCPSGVTINCDPGQYPVCINGQMVCAGSSTAGTTSAMNKKSSIVVDVARNGSVTAIAKVSFSGWRGWKGLRNPRRRRQLKAHVRGVFEGIMARLRNRFSIPEEPPPVEEPACDSAAQPTCTFPALPQCDEATGTWECVDDSGGSGGDGDVNDPDTGGGIIDPGTIGGGSSGFNDDNSSIAGS